MAAKDYEFKSDGQNVYLAKHIKDSEKISTDRRPLTDSEILGLFSYYFKGYCLANETDEMTVNLNGSPFFVAKMVPKTEEGETPEAPETI